MFRERSWTVWEMGFWDGNHEQFESCVEIHFAFAALNKLRNSNSVRGNPSQGVSHKSSRWIDYSSNKFTSHLRFRGCMLWSLCITPFSGHQTAEKPQSSSARSDSHFPLLSRLVFRWVSACKDQKVERGVDCENRRADETSRSVQSKTKIWSYFLRAYQVEVQCGKCETITQSVRESFSHYVSLKGCFWYSVRCPKVPCFSVNTKHEQDIGDIIFPSRDFVWSFFIFLS
jgi:hypothetical protein